MRVDLGSEGELTLTSRIRNTNSDGKPFTFTFAYHTYFSVSDIRYSPFAFMYFHANLVQFYLSFYQSLELSCIGCLVFSEVRVEGLETLDYLDNLTNRERFTEQGDAITFESEVSLQSQSLRSF